MTEDDGLDPPFVPFSEGQVECPCGAKVDVPVLARIMRVEDDMIIELQPDMTDLWAHSWVHETWLEGDANERPERD